jgi:integrase
MGLAGMSNHGIISKACEGAGKGLAMAKFLFWRGNSLYCRYPVPGWPESYPLKIYTTGSASDKLKCARLAENKLAEIRYKLQNGTLFEKEPEKAPPEKAPYNPKYWRIVGRYWYYHLRFVKSVKNERYSLMASLKKFGNRTASEIYREDIELWRKEMVDRGDKINSINNRYAYMCAAYTHANNENNPRYHFAFNPTRGMKKLPGASVRTFVLTQEKFERNYEYLKKTFSRSAILYLALWETGRRPKEVSEYRWEWVREVPINGRPVHIVFVPPEVAKTEEPDNVILSDRLWGELSQLGYRHGYIFRNRTGAQLRSWRRPKDALEKKFGSDAGWFRDCRRGMITHKCEVQGCDPVNVQKISGHRTQSVFNRYRIGNMENLLEIVNTPTNGRQFEVLNG